MYHLQEKLASLDEVIMGEGPVQSRIKLVTRIYPVLDKGLHALLDVIPEETYVLAVVGTVVRQSSYPV
jgi:hypothetical protein